MLGDFSTTHHGWIFWQFEIVWTEANQQKVHFLTTTWTIYKIELDSDAANGCEFSEFPEFF